MNRENQDRVALIDWMLEARRQQELEAAEKNAEGWLKVNPDDVRVIAASERFAKMGARVRVPECGANRLVVGMLAAGASADAFTRRWRGCSLPCR